MVDAVLERGWELVSHNYEQGDLLTNYQFDPDGEEALECVGDHSCLPVNFVSHGGQTGGSSAPGGEHLKPALAPKPTEHVAHQHSAHGRLQERLPGRVVAGQIGRQELDRHLAVQARVPGRVHNAHAAVAQSYGPS